ncbi:hypothetical protein [Sphingomonas rubra]|uniref:Uncharacterized protein n=1 Tax=Sphingomonas rubra TaxID=634430 RepID=A0A1I5UXI9_9SPHN|nr:hypothetical protein [Sphingomonas rubra]SFP99940.1 hypothetical protein SAMN04488241_11916 [Sphingomonas rubra]
MPDTMASDTSPSDFDDVAKKTTDAGIADETAGYAEAAALSEEDAAAGGTKTVPTEGGEGEVESAAQPS